MCFFSLNSRFWQCLILIHMYVHVCVLVCFTQDSARLTEIRKKEDEQFAWATISVYHFRNVCQPRLRYL